MTTYVYVSLSDAADEYHFVPGDHIGGPDCVISGNGGDPLNHNGSAQTPPGQNGNRLGVRKSVV